MGIIKEFLALLEKKIKVTTKEKLRRLDFSSEYESLSANFLSWNETVHLLKTYRENTLYFYTPI